MKRSTRRILFYGLAALFFIAGAAIVLYAQGWRLDFAAGKAEKIGAIFVRSYPDDAAIFLNGKQMQNQSGFLSRGTLLSELFPKTYRLELTAPGYDAWQENIAVLPSFVATLKYAVLVPANATSAASGTVQNFLEAPGNIITESTEGTIAANDASVGRGTIVSASADRSAAIVKNPNGNYYLYDARDGGTENLSSLLAKSNVEVTDISNINVSPYDPATIIAAGPKKIWLLDAATNAVTQIENAPSGETVGPSVAVSNSSAIAWMRASFARGTSRLLVYNQPSQTVSASSTVVIGANKKLAWITGNLLGILQVDGSLYIYDAGNKTLRKLADNVVDFSATEDGTIVAALERSSVEIFSLNDPAGYYRFNPPDITDVAQLIWYKDDSHLFAVYPDHVAFLDLADLGLNNFTTVGSGTKPSYDVSQNALYLIDPSAKLVRYNFPE